MEAIKFMPLILGLVIFSFLVTSILVVPFIDILYKFRFTRRKEAPKNGKVPLFDRLHDKKAGTPVGGGVLLIAVVCILFAVLFPISSRMGVFIQTSFKLREELFIIFFTFISFGILGAIDDLVKTFGKPVKGVLGLAFGITRKQKFIVQWILGFVIGYLIYKNLGVHILNIPLFGVVWDLGIWYIPFAAFVIVSFTNAFNITDGLDGLSCGVLMICLFASSLIQIVGRKLFKRGIFPIAPIHHTFLAIGWEEPKIVTRAWLAGIIFAIFGLWLTTI